MKPTITQKRYAEALVQQIRDANQLEAESYARLVMQCQDRDTMSKLIGQMVGKLRMGTIF